MTKPLYLLDSNICIYILDGHPPSVRSRLERYAPEEIVTSAVVYAEVMRGLEHRSEKDRQAAKNLFQAITPLPFGEPEARAYARLPFRRAGFDRLIGAHVLALDLTLVTANVRDFRDIPGLRVEDWTQ